MYLEHVWWAKLELLSQRIGSTSTHPVEDVIVALLRALSADTRLLEEVVRDVATAYHILQKNKNVVPVLTTQILLKV